eukprot:CAMPEP_0182838458 /NCGR_PEP_ID=MMETSP0006_2-20121128/23317_1 /TAXON_ID=97485 /ORGANISM="Prymnesium parvum, Strain Texoma1" /LENGTH=146 /DNA_ID=CAMNT_0024967489 /DNA_START=589 /DNA_END=1030 /DNA_ORIENTATION=+
MTDTLRATPLEGKEAPKQQPRAAAEAELHDINVTLATRGGKCRLQGGELELDKMHAKLAQQLEERFLRWIQKDNGPTSLSKPCCTTDAMHVFFGVLRKIILHYPVDILEVQPSSSHVGAEQYAALQMSEPLEHCSALLLAELPMQP